MQGSMSALDCSSTCTRIIALWEAMLGTAGPNSDHRHWQLRPECHAASYETAQARQQCQCSSSMTRACERRIGWLANTLMSIVVIAVGITMIYYWTDICDRNPSWSYKCQNRA